MYVRLAGKRLSSAHSRWRISKLLAGDCTTSEYYACVFESYTIPQRRHSHALGLHRHIHTILYISTETEVFRLLDVGCKIDVGQELFV